MQDQSMIILYSIDTELLLPRVLVWPFFHFFSSKLLDRKDSCTVVSVVHLRFWDRIILGDQTSVYALKHELYITQLLSLPAEKPVLKYQEK